MIGSVGGPGPGESCVVPGQGEPTWRHVPRPPPYRQQPHQQPPSHCQGDDETDIQDASHGGMHNGCSWTAAAW
jgi:hypothetical protein